MRQFVLFERYFAMPSFLKNLIYFLISDIVLRRFRFRESMVPDADRVAMFVISILREWYYERFDPS